LPRLPVTSFSAVGVGFLPVATSDPLLQFRGNVRECLRSMFNTVKFKF
jgi:hypothetical protein